jgi:hypothetical protein
MRPLKLEQSNAMNSNKRENETTKTRTIRYYEQQQNRMKPLKLEQSDTTNSNKTENKPLKLEQSDTLNRNKTENETTKTGTIIYN